MTKASKSAEQGALTPEEEAKQARILSKGDGYAAYCFARDNPAADVEALQDVILVLGDGEDAYLFARDIPGANVQALQETVLTRGDAYDAYLFALKIPDANFLACTRRIMNLDPRDERKFLRGLRKKCPEVFTPEVLANLSLGVIL